MKEPVFPVEFLDQHCIMVQEARRHRRIYKIQNLTNQDDLEHAECAFQRAGAGMECQSCKLFLTRPYVGREVDEKFLPLIEQYYAEMNEYELFLLRKKADEMRLQSNSMMGAGI